MKKILSSVIAVLIGVAIVTMVLKREESPPFTDIFPKDAVAYVGLVRGGELAAEILQSRTWRSINNLESFRRFKTRVAENIGKRGVITPTIGTLMDLLGGKFAVALYGQESQFGASLLLALETDRPERVTKALGGLKGRPAGSYAGADLYSLKSPILPGIDGAYALKGDTIVLCFSRARSLDMVKAVIEKRYLKDGNSLSEDEDLRSGLGEPPSVKGSLLGCAYVDFRALAKNIRIVGAFKEKLNEKNPALVDAAARMWSQYRVFLSCGGYLYRDRGLVGKTLTRLDSSGLTAEERAVYLGDPTKLKSISLVPRGTVALSTYRLGNVQETWNFYKRQTRASSPLAILKKIENKLGINLEREVLPWLGKEMSIQLSDVVTGGLLPVPRVEILLEVKDRRAAEKELDRLMERLAQAPTQDAQSGQQPMAFFKPQLQTENYRGVTLRTLTYPIPGFSPSCAIIGRYLIIGSDRSSVQGVIDIQKGLRKPILKNDEFAELFSLVPHELNYLSYVDCRRVLEIGEGVLKWFLTVKKLAFKAGDQEGKSDLETLEADLPKLLDALKVFRAAMSASTSSGNSIEQYFILRVEENGR